MDDTTADLQLVHATLDAIGVEAGPLPLRLAFLRGAAAGLGGRRRRWDPVMPDRPAAEPLATGPTLAPAAGPLATEPAGPTLAPVQEPSAGEDADDDDPGTDAEWSAGGNRAFMAAVRDYGVMDRYEVIAAFFEACSRSRKRPSRLTRDERETAIAKLQPGTDTRVMYDEWVGAHGEAVVAELRRDKRGAA